MIESTFCVPYVFPFPTDTMLYSALKRVICTLLKHKKKGLQKIQVDQNAIIIKWSQPSYSLNEKEWHSRGQRFDPA